MRLSSSLSKQIVASIEKSFGPVDIYLFGSRTNDLKRGGDIDIAIDSKLSKKGFKKAKIAAITQLIEQNLDELSLSLDITQLSSAEGIFADEIERTKIKL